MLSVLKTIDLVEDEPLMLQVQTERVHYPSDAQGPGDQIQTSQV
jgi:hypothetical protein